MKFSKLPIQKYCIILFSPVFFIGLLLQTNVSAQKVSAKPFIKKVMPTDIFPDMFITITGSGLGTDDGETEVIFSQDEIILTARPDGGGVGDDGLWSSVVQVPLGLKSGKCKIEVEVGNQKSLSFFVKVSQTAKPPKLTSVSEIIVNPGYFVWINGSGFINNQILEMTDAEGQKFTKTISGTSSDNNLSFDVPATAYSGIAKFRVIENRNGTPQVSNELKFEIRSGAIPVSFNESFFVPLARGQWFNLSTNDSRPLSKATKIELKLTQGQITRTSFISNFRRLYFQVPKSFHLGKMNVKTRTWIGNEVSEWSKPVVFKVVQKAAIPTFYGLDTYPVKAEAMFKQNGEIVAISPIILSVLPRVSFPPELKKGNLEVYTRYWNKGNFTDWKQVSNSSYFDIENVSYTSQFNKQKSYTLNSFFEKLYFENNKSKFYQIERGNDLVIYGDFYVKSATDLSVLLENGKEQISLKTSEHELLGAVIVNIPTSVSTGDWRLWLLDKDKKLETRLPIKLRLD